MLVPAEYQEQTEQTLMTEWGVHKAVEVPTKIGASIGKDGLVGVTTVQGLSSVCINLTPDEAEHFACILFGLSQASADQPAQTPAPVRQFGRAAGSDGGDAAAAVAPGGG